MAGRSKFGRGASHQAVGQWSNPWSRINAEQSPQKIRVWLQDKLVARGKFVYLYLPVSSATSGVTACSCVKDTTTQADRECFTCYGTQFAPGYQRFMHATTYWCSSLPSSLTLTNTVVDTSKKVNIVTLPDDGTTLSGTIVTTDKAFTNPQSATNNWEVELCAFPRSPTATVTLEYSLNAGVAYTSVALTVTPLQPPSRGLSVYRAALTGAALGASGNIRFRITMTRASGTDRSPAFEIVRLRRATPENDNKLLKSFRSDYTSGKILILRTWVMDVPSLDPARGRQEDHQADRAWTVPLDFFDSSLTAEQPAARITETLGPHPFYLYAGGVQAGTRYAITKTSFNEQLGIFTHQFADDRRTQDGEAYGLVF